MFRSLSSIGVPVKPNIEAFGIADINVHDIDASLEDVFVRLTETRGREIETQRATMVSREVV